MSNSWTTSKVKDAFTSTKKLPDLGRERYGSQRTHTVTLGFSAVEFAYLQRVCSHQQWSYRQWVEHAMLQFNRRVQGLQGPARGAYLCALSFWSPPIAARLLRCKVFQVMFDEEIAAFVQPYSIVRVSALLRWVLWTEMEELLARPPASKHRAPRWEITRCTRDGLIDPKAPLPSLENPLPKLLSLAIPATEGAVREGLEPIAEALPPVFAPPEPAQELEQPSRRQQMLQHTDGTRRTRQIGLGLSPAEYAAFQRMCAHRQWSYRQGVEYAIEQFIERNRGPDREKCLEGLATWSAPAPAQHFVNCVIHERLRTDCMQMLTQRVAKIRFATIVRWALISEAKNILATPPAERTHQLNWQTAHDLKALTAPARVLTNEVDGGMIDLEQLASAMTAQSPHLTLSATAAEVPSRTPQLALGATETPEPPSEVVQPVSVRPAPAQELIRNLYKRVDSDPQPLDFPTDWTDKNDWEGA